LPGSTIELIISSAKNESFFRDTGLTIEILNDVKSKIIEDFKKINALSKSNLREVGFK
jgi:hypothetical protein